MKIRIRFLIEAENENPLFIDMPDKLIKEAIVMPSNLIIINNKQSFYLVSNETGFVFQEQEKVRCEMMDLSTKRK